MPKFAGKSKRKIQKPLPTQPVGRSYYQHRVSIIGESLSIIAKWFTGNLKNWEQLASANPHLNPNRINIGDEILIPEDMMIRKDPITKGFVDSFTSPPKKKKAAVKPEPEVSEPEAKAEPVPSPPPEVSEPTIEEPDLELVPPKF